jgi:AI-2 transport protein TqsA
VFSPVMDLLVLKGRLPRELAMAVTFILVLASLLVVSFMVGEAVHKVITTASSYSEDLAQSGEQFFGYLEKKGVEAEYQKLIAQIRDRLPGLVTNAVGRGLSMISTLFLTLIFVFFLLWSRDPRTAHEGVYAQIDREVRRYLVVKIVISVTMGLIVWGVLAAFGLKLAGVFGMLAFVLDFIPSIGSIVATLLPVPVALAQFSGVWWKLALVIAIPGICQLVMGNVVEPKVFGRRMDLHPIAVILAIGFWGLLWGMVGAFLAVPLTSVIRLILLQFESLRSVGE